MLIRGGYMKDIRIHTQCIVIKIFYYLPADYELTLCNRDKFDW
jgi:hypothetical protein